jgi:hypothetical protein
MTRSKTNISALPGTRYIQAASEKRKELNIKPTKTIEPVKTVNSETDAQNLKAGPYTVISIKTCLTELTDEPRRIRPCMPNDK